MRDKIHKNFCFLEVFSLLVSIYANRSAIEEASQKLEIWDLFEEGIHG